MGNSTHTNAESTVTSPIPLLTAETAECRWLVTSDGTQHHVRVWEGTAPHPVIVQLHGIEGHSRWFEPTALMLNNHGCTVIALDRRGAGASKEPRGDVGQYQRLVADVEEVIAQIAGDYPSRPLFLAANCWGGKVGIAVAAGKLGSRLSGLILTSPAVSTQVDVNLGTKLQIAWNYLSAGGRGTFDIPLTVQHFTDNPAYAKFIEIDPLRLKQATARFFIESLKLTRACRKAAPLLRLPVLVLQSGRDAIVRLSGLETWFSTVGSSDKTLKIFTSAAHSLDFEANPTDYQNLLLAWIISRGPGVQAT